MFEGLCTVLFAIRDSCCLFYPIIAYHTVRHCHICIQSLYFFPTTALARSAKASLRLNLASSITPVDAY